MLQTGKQMLEMIRSEITGHALQADLFQDFSDQDWQNLLALSERHDLAHLPADVIARDDLLPSGELKNKFEKIFCEAVLRARLLEKECKNICALFGKAQIRHLPLKGAFIRKLYPEPWMRTSCDLDILIHRTDLQKAKELLTGQCGYRTEKHAYHEISMYAPSGVHLELHFSIEAHTAALDCVLRRGWDYAVPAEKPYEYNFRNEFLIFYSVAHAAYHFQGGGCGVRPVADLFLLQQKLEYDRAEYEELVKQAGLQTFAARLEKLSRVWFCGEEHDDLTRRMETYLLLGGVYGTLEGRETVRLIRNKGRWVSFWQRVWLPYIDLIIRYPRLKGRRILQPLYEIRRWLTLFKGKIFKRIAGEVKTNFRVSSKQKSQTKQLMNDLDLLK